MKMKCLFVFVLLITFTGSYKEKAKAASHFDITTELFAVEEGNVAPSFTMRPVDFTVTEKQTVSINARFVGVPYPKVEVFMEKTLLRPSDKYNFKSEFNMITFTINDVKEEDAGDYSIKISNKAGSVTAKFRLTVNKAN